MKVILVNGSPNEKGCTNRALFEVSDALNKEGIETQQFWVGKKPLSGCTACMNCMVNKKCIFDDSVNEFLKIASNFDGFVFGTPVHWAAASGALTSFLDRVFYADFCSGNNSFYLKPGATVISARRAGTTATFDQINKYFGLMQMPIIASQYWNMVHGTTPQEVEKDLEGLQTMRVLAKNMAYFLKCKEAAEKAGIPLPKQEERVFTNFVR